MSAKQTTCDCTIIHEDVVQEVVKNLPQDEVVYSLADFFKVFGDTSRTKMLLALDYHEMCVCDLASLLDVTKSAVSHQLRSLREANLVKSRREGKVVYYSLADNHIISILKQGLEHIAESTEETDEN